jgi:hypothetical protein
MGVRPTQGDEKRLGPASTLHGTYTLSFVIPSDCDLLISLTGLLWMERASPLFNNHPIPWQRSFLFQPPSPFCHPERSRGICGSLYRWRETRGNSGTLTTFTPCARLNTPAGAARPAMTAPAEGTPGDTRADHGFQRRCLALSTFVFHRI